MSKKIRTHYDNLKIANDAPDEVIKAAHKALVQKHHPDKTENKDEAHRIIKLINEARDVLLNPTLITRVRVNLKSMCVECREPVPTHTDS
ncbi:MAG: hypothetical protein D0528_11790 [Methylococcales bacterium]|nr:MAG: hypothetical protein D0528_11790 [Methylococcales bacterium]